MTQLENSGAIAVPTSRRIVLRSRGALNRMNVKLDVARGWK